jgi:hypothetical protein
MKLFSIACLGLLLSAAAPAQEEPKQDVIYEALPERAPEAVVAAAPEPLEPVTWQWPGAFQERNNIHDLGPISDEEIAAADQEAARLFGEIQPGPVRVGTVRRIAPRPLSIENGSVLSLRTEDGETVWTMAIRSPGAFGVRVHFSAFDVGEGSVVVYSDYQGEPLIRGPFTGRGPNRDGNFWTPWLPGDVVFVEAVGAPEPRFEIAEIVHFDRDPARPGDDWGTGGAQPCHNDVMCRSVNSVARDATGQMNFVSGGQATVCSGTMLNDLDAETVVPYFLTAYHCLHFQSEANSLEVVWFWQKNACNGTLPDYARLPRSIQGTILETNPTSGGNDMTFLRLNYPPPPGVPYAGWTTAHPDNGTAIHHPAGDWKRVTFLSSVDFCPKCSLCGDPSDYDYYNINDGLLEGGSSGSGIFNASGQLFGQWFGTCCVSLACAGLKIQCLARDGFTAKYGEFETTYPIIRRWLEIGGTINVNRAYGGTEEGTPARPFRTVTAAHGFAWHGSRIKIQPGSYPEVLTLSKQLTVLGGNGLVRIGQ